MLTASTALQNTIKQSMAVTASPRVIAEWNHNRYSPITTVDNFGFPEATSGYDLDTFPISSIVQPVRPTAGILLGKTGEGIVTSSWSDQPGSYRSYTASPTNKYKYWCGPNQTNSTAYARGGYTMFGGAANPYIIYTNSVWTNKIYICFETSFSTPVAFNVETTTDGTTWTQVAQDIVPNSKGQVILYRQSDNSWGTGVYRANPTKLKGVKLTVLSMSKQKAFANVIELGLRLEDDLTPYLIDYSIDMEMADDDSISPVGDISANTGSINLSNLDGRFNNDPPSGTDPTPLYRGLIDANVRLTIDLGINTSAFGGSGLEYLRQATVLSDGWNGDDETSKIDLKDDSKYLQENNPPAMLMTDVTIGQAIWRLLDSIGFNSFAYNRGASESPTVIPFFWTDPTKTVWEQIQSLCRTTQTAAYFDANGVFQIKTREAAFDQTKISGAGNWTLDYAPNGSKQPDIVTLDVTGAYEANHAIIHYRPTALAVDAQGRPVSEVVWQPDGDEVLRSSSLKADMTAGQMFFIIDQTASITWPYDGMVNIRGELIRYKGKEYRYVNKSGVWTYATLYSTDDKNHIDNDLSSATLGFQNYFTGKMFIIERGYDWTTAAAHDTTIASWIAAPPAFNSIGGATTNWSGGIKHIPEQSIMRITGRSSWNSGIWYQIPRQTVLASPPTNIGTRLKFPSSPRGNVDIGGVFFYANAAETTMYMVEICSTTYIDGSKLRSARDEVIIYKRTGGTLKSISGRGMAITVARDIWNDIDITVNGNTISVFVNGHLAANATDTVSPLASTGKLGLYTRGYTVMDAEYFYHAAGAGWPNPDTDNSSYLDLILGGYYSQQNYNDGFYLTRTAKRKSGNRTVTYKQVYAQRVFDEFGILVHEVRPYTITFDKFPVTYSDLYFSNTYQAVPLEYIGTPFGASFILANASRHDATLNGDDAVTYGSDNVVSQKLMVTGRTVQQQDEKTVEVKDAAAILRRGDIPIDFTADWIQTAAAANQLAAWITAHWATPADQVDVESFGNPILEITDVVGINYPNKNMAATTHQYYVLKISHQYADGGLSTTFSLRRAR